MGLPVPEAGVLKIVATIGEIGDERIFVSELTLVVRIGSGKVESNADAL